jgi:hypothetical protein
VKINCKSVGSAFEGFSPLTKGRKRPQGCGRQDYTPARNEQIKMKIELRGIVLLFFGGRPCPARKNRSLPVGTIQRPSCSRLTRLPRKVCLDWQRRSFQDFPDALAQYRSPKNKSAADAGVIALIRYFNREMEANNARRIPPENVTVGDWARKFIEYETSPRTRRNASLYYPFQPFRYVLLAYRIHQAGPRSHST